MFVLSSVCLFFRLGEHVNFNSWWHMRVPVTDLMNPRGRGGECPPKTSNPFPGGPCLWILVDKKPNFPTLFQTSEFRCLFLKPLWYEDTLSWTTLLEILTPSSSWPPSMQCLSFSGPLYVPWVPICIYQVYCRTKDKRFFFHSLTCINASKSIQSSRRVQVQKNNYATLQMYISAQRETKQSKR